MKVIELSTLKEFLDRPMWDTHTMIFRGVADAEYDLVPSLGRFKVKSEEQRLEYEENLIQEFKRRAFPHLVEKPQNYVDWLCLAQHYGLPTRLLDWTTSPLIALYFATEKHPEKDFAVFKRIQNKWYLEYPETKANDVQGVFGVRPPQTDTRFINQDGVFTIHEHPATPLDDESVVKFVFPSRIKEEVNWVIRKYGVRPSRIYPGLEGVSKDIIQELSRYTRGNALRSTGSPIDPWA